MDINSVTNMNISSVTSWYQSTKKQQVSTHSLIFSIFNILLSGAKNLIFNSNRQIKILNIMPPLHSIPSIRSKKYFNESFFFKDQQSNASKEVEEILIPYKPISIKHNPIKTSQTKYNIMSLVFNPFNKK